MKTKKTLIVEIGITAEEIKELVVKHLADTHEEFKKINDESTKPTVAFIISNSVFDGCHISITKVK